MSTSRWWLLLGLSWACNGAPAGAPASPSGSRADTRAEAASAERSKASITQVASAPRGQPQPQLALGSLELELPPRAPLKLRVEVAATDRERQFGLMFRTQLGDDEGMLFLFPTERYNSFWMRNTLIPLDMYFIDSEWNVVGVVENAKPLTEDPRQVDKMSQYVLEVNAGFAAKHRLGAGAKVKFVPPPGLVVP